MDEIEKGFSDTSGAGDSGTSARVFGTFLTWMQEKTSPVFIVATANKIEALPPEMLRKGRFDEIFFVDFPNFGERKQIFNIHISKRLKSEKARGTFVVDETVLSRLASESRLYTGSEIEQATIDGLLEAFHENRSVCVDDFAGAVQRMAPLSATMMEKIKAIRQWADERAVRASKPDETVSDPAALHRQGGRNIEFTGREPAVS